MREWVLRARITVPGGVASRPARFARRRRLRSETPADVDAIDALLARAFAGHSHSHQTEGAIVRALRAAGALSLSLIAEDDGGGVIRHVAASPVRVDGAERG